MEIARKTVAALVERMNRLQCQIDLTAPMSSLSYTRVESKIARFVLDGETMMNAMEKVAWTELVVSVAATVLASLLIPWLGSQAAASGFALLGLIGLSGALLRRRGNRVVVDERDREIARRATSIGVGTAWMSLFMTLIAATMWSSYTQTHSVSTAFLNWLIWIQFAICYGTQGLVMVVMYRRQQHAA
jgi:hypothetical protein